MRIGSIDIGTNTALFVIADTDGRQIHTLHDDHEIIRLGEGVDAARVIRPEAMKRCAEAIRRFKNNADAFRCDALIAAATSAVRDAANRHDFLAYMLETTGIEIEIFSGSEEALCTYLGGCLVLPEPERQQKTAVIDIGGGSTEIILGAGDTIRFKTSIDIGSVRLTERFLKSDPVCLNEENLLRQTCRELLKKELNACPSLSEYTRIGVAGTITTLAAMIQKMNRYQREAINGFLIHFTDLQEQIQTLRRLRIEERKSLAGLEPKRADVIFAGAVILEEIMQFCQWPTLVAADYGLRYGMILRKLGHFSMM